ncbi:MAG: formyltetrahydrofolate deformylase [Bryobacterales bacterium]|jgi:formyltetrahydrofolate deformylase|nr:formyltetrahydrofolate deformylase [Bryobacterales bacterium]
MSGSTTTLLVNCPDQRGLVAAVSGFLYRMGANILHADQHQDNELGLFFMRVEWTTEGLSLQGEALREAFQGEVAEPHGMQWRMEESARKPRVAIFVSHYDHCLLDLLHRQRSGELGCEIPLVIGNHPTCRSLAEYYGAAFHHIPVSAETKTAAEDQQAALLEAHRVDLVVLARYMQVLSPRLLARFPGRIINVHHSFLPAFVGARPYHAAFERGVKLIGATSHYVTEELDEGPIIEQDVVRISHRDQLQDLIQKGRDLERVVLSRAVRWHLANRILLFGRKTVVFD